MPRISLCLSLLLGACGTSEPSAANETKTSVPNDEIVEGVEPDARLSEGELGKGDYAFLSAELACVEGAFDGDEEQKARAAVIAKWKTTDEWVQGVRNQVALEPGFAQKLAEQQRSRSEQVCPGGAPSPSFLAAIGMAASEGAPASGQ